MRSFFIIVFYFAIYAVAMLFVEAAFANNVDNSINQPTFPPAGLTLLTTVVAQAGTRNAITIQNQSADQIQVWRSIPCGGPPISPVLIAPGAVNQQGGSWSSNTFKGCAEIYGASGDRVGIWQD